MRINIEYNFSYIRDRRDVDYKGMLHYDLLFELPQKFVLC
jgi:hypothetical protein